MSFQPQHVRASTRFYPRFTLAMGRSTGFGSNSIDSFALFRLGFPAAPPLSGLTLPMKLTRRPIMQKVCGQAFVPRKERIALPLLVSARFQGLFHSPHRGAFHLSLTVLYAIGRQVVFSLGGWSPQIPAGFHVPCGTRVSLEPVAAAYRTITFYGRPFHAVRLTASGLML
jgi:hypothetical protein